LNFKSVVPRERAMRDVEDIVDHYLIEAGEKIALAFIDALERTYGHLARHPTAGSLRYAHELALPGLRFWRLRPYPYLVFYIERDDNVDVWRVLHEERDIPAWMRDAV
jgi:toxin ParE1/3/4